MIVNERSPSASLSTLLLFFLCPLVDISKCVLGYFYLFSVHILHFFYIYCGHLPFYFFLLFWRLERGIEPEAYGAHCPRRTLVRKELWQGGLEPPTSGSNVVTLTTQLCCSGHETCAKNAKVGKNAKFSRGRETFASPKSGTKVPNFRGRRHFGTQNRVGDCPDTGFRAHVFVCLRDFCKNSKLSQRK